jgi:hypothetical protein
MDQLFLKSFIMAETMVKAGASFGQTKATPLSRAPDRERGRQSPYVSELNQTRLAAISATRTSSTYGEERGNKFRGNLHQQYLIIIKRNDGKSDFAKALRSNEFIV